MRPRAGSKKFAEAKQIRSIRKLKHSSSGNAKQNIGSVLVPLINKIPGDETSSKQTKSECRFCPEKFIDPDCYIDHVYVVHRNRCTVCATVFDTPVSSFGLVSILDKFFC